MSARQDDPEINRLAAALSEQSDDPVPVVIRKALAERWERLRHKQEKAVLAERLKTIALRCASLPGLDTRSPDESLGYGDDGLWR